MTQVASGTSSIEFPFLVGFAADGASIVVEVPKDDGPVWRSLTVGDGKWAQPELGPIHGSHWAGGLPPRRDLSH
jgi:hypothetical protein